MLEEREAKLLILYQFSFLEQPQRFSGKWAGWAKFNSSLSFLRRNVMTEWMASGASGQLLLHCFLILLMMTPQNEHREELILMKCSKLTHHHLILFNDAFFNIKCGEKDTFINPAYISSLLFE